MSKTNFEFLDALGQIARDKGISVETLLDALANALVAAYKRRPDAAEEAVVTIDPDSGEIRVYGQELDEDGEVIREWDDTPDDFGRIAAQTAKQVILQRIREVERDMKYEEYAGREGDIVTGIVQQTDNRYTLLDLGKVEALLPQAEQVSYERYEHGARLKAYIVEVRKTTKGPQIVVSRTHPGLIKRLFELEVPEIGSGVVEIKAAAREPGHRTKIAVWSNDPNVDPVGACVGARGLAGAHGDQRAARRARRRRAVLGRPGRAHSERAGPGPRARGAPRRGDRHGHGDRERLPALARHRQGGAERPPGRPPHRLAHRHQERDPAGRGGGRATATRSGPRASGSRTRAARWSGSRPRAARPCRPRSGRTRPRSTGEAPAAEAAQADGAAEAPAEARARGEPAAGAEVGRAELVRGGGRGDGGGRGIAPTRTCVGCRRALPADAADPGRPAARAGRCRWTGTGPGGEPGCAGGRSGCLDEAVRRHGFDRAFAASGRGRRRRAVACAPG